MTDVSNLDDLANGIASSSPKIKAYAKAQATATQSQEPDIQSRAKQADLAALTARVAALELAVNPPPPPPSGSLLKWKPPGYPSYAGYQAIHVSNATARRSLATGVDYRVIIDEPITVDGGVMLQGGRNIVLIGGEIFDSTVLTQAQAQASPSQLWRQIGLYLTNISGTCHVEGLWIHGVGCGDGIQVGGGNANAIIQVQNCRIHNMHPTQNPGTTGGWDGAHPDAFQIYGGGPAAFRMYQDTIISSGTLRTWQPFDSSPGGAGPNLGLCHMERMNILAQQGFGSYVIWDDASPLWPEVHKDIWLSYGQSGNLHRNADISHAQWDPPNGNVTGEAIKWGVRPEGDWVPAPSVRPSACGMNYVSPGYAS